MSGRAAAAAGIARKVRRSIKRSYHETMPDWPPAGTKLQFDDLAGESPGPINEYTVRLGAGFSIVKLTPSFLVVRRVSGGSGPSCSIVSRLSKLRLTPRR